jgi:hypothetical protein
MQMKHYVVVNDWVNEYESGTSILGVAHSLEEAKEIFNNSLAEEKHYAEEYGWEIYDDCETVFDAGKDGYYISNHTNLYIQLV